MLPWKGVMFLEGPGGRRLKSTVWWWTCATPVTTNPPRGAHHNKDTALYLHQWGQRKAMLEQGWSTYDFIREFGKNYL